MAEAVGNNKKGKALKYPCLRCKKDIKQEQRSVQCQTCQLWVHVSCQEISDELFKILVEPDRYGGVCWNCDCCMASAVRLEATVRAFETRVKLVEDATAKTANDVKIVNTEVAALRREFEEERRRTREALENRDEKFVTKEELREREARKLNVILHRVKEAGEDLRTGEERRNHDTEECGKIFRSLHLEEEDESNQALQENWRGQPGPPPPCGGPEVRRNQKEAPGISKEPERNRLPGNQNCPGSYTSAEE